jgi:hypothetical protein
MPERLEDLLRACTVHVAGANPGAGFFVAPGKVLTCRHVIGDGSLPVPGRPGLVIRWERDGQEPAEFGLAGVPLVLPGRGRPIRALEEEYPDIAVLDVDAPAGHPCVLLDTGMPWHEDGFQAYGYPEEGGSAGPGKPETPPQPATSTPRCCPAGNGYPARTTATP